MVRHANLWFESCPTKREITSGLIKNVDTLIIGGGLAGISLLYYLVQGGMINTYLVEETSVGFHASGRGMGQLLLRGNKLFHEMSDGEEYLEFVGENNRRFLNGMRVLTFDHDMRETGGLRLAIDDEEMSKLEKEAAFIQRVRGIDCPVLSRRQLDLMVPQKNFVGGIFVPNEATYNPYKVVNGLRDAVEKGGTRVFTNTQVESVVPNDDGSLTVSIRHRGTIRAKQVVYCTGAYTNRLLPEFADILVPFREQMIATDYLENDIVQSLPTMSISCNNGNERFRQYNARLIMGGMRQAVRGQQEGIVYDGEISSAVYEKLRLYAIESFPVLKSAKFSHVWSSVFCSTPDGKPLVGPVPDKPNQYILTGFGCYDSSNAILGSMMIKDYIKHKDSTVPGHKILNPGRFLNV
jgi:glycine/D-amino acid oxidase-like deaminating enzyme